MLTFAGFVDQERKLNDAFDYYARGGEDRLKSGASFVAESVRRTANAHELLREVARVLKPPLIVSHATPSSPGYSGGLLMPVGPGSEHFFDDEAIDLILTRPTDAKADAAAAKVLQVDARTLASLRALSEQIRARKLAQIVIRGCNIGMTDDALLKLRKFFGCPICAPRVEFCSGKLNIGIVGRDRFIDWTASHFNCHEEDGVAYQIASGRAFEFGIEAVSIDADTMVRFCNRHGLTASRRGITYVALDPDRSKLVFHEDAEYSSLLNYVS